MSAYTAKNYQIGKAPRHITLLGDKTVRPESAQHIIEFPGGAVEVSRTSDGRYWAHILVNRGQVIDDCDGRVSAVGQVIDSRVWRDGDGLSEIGNHAEVSQIAVLIGSAA